MFFHSCAALELHTTALCWCIVSALGIKHVCIAPLIEPLYNMPHSLPLLWQTHAHTPTVERLWAAECSSQLEGISACIAYIKKLSPQQWLIRVHHLPMQRHVHFAMQPPVHCPSSSVVLVRRTWIACRELLVRFPRFPLIHVSMHPLQPPDAPSHAAPSRTSPCISQCYPPMRPACAPHMCIHNVTVIT